MLGNSKKKYDNSEFLIRDCSFAITHFQLLNKSILGTCYVPGTILCSRENVTFIESSVCASCFSTNCFHLLNTYYGLSPTLLPGAVLVLELCQ